MTSDEYPYTNLYSTSSVLRSTDRKAYLRETKRIRNVQVRESDAAKHVSLRIENDY